MHERLDLQRVDPTYHLVFDDGSQLALTSDMKSMQEQLESIQPGSFQGFLRYLQEGERHYQLVLDKLVNRDFRKASDFFNLQNLPLIFRLKPLINHYRNMSAYFDEPRLKSAFTFQDIYTGLSPFEAPATFSMMPYTELAHGVWYPKGGMYSIVETLMDLARQAGVEFIFNSAVERIDVNSTHARGVLLADGSRLEADVVLANADLPYVYQHLLPQDGMAKALARKRFSCSVISFFWGVDKTYPEPRPAYAFPGGRLPRELREHRAGPEPARQSQPLPSRPGAARPLHGSARAGYPDCDRPGRAHERKWRTELGEASR